MSSEEVSLPLIHEHLMMPWNDLRKGDCCGRFEAISDGYYCKSCDFFVHKKCGDECSEFIEHPCHSIHTLTLVRGERIKRGTYCDLCGKSINVNLYYSCKICDFDVDLYCAKYPPPEVIDISETHNHKLTLIKKHIEFDCDAKCGNDGYGFRYKCHECEVSFHVDCVWNPSEVKHLLEVNHSHHSLHPLKLLTGLLPIYIDETCRLCGREIEDRLFYHCSSCNFSLDMRCVLNPPPQYLLDFKAHDHQLTLLPRLGYFICNACGMQGDRSPYICIQCDFMIHQDCLDLPLLIEINRHDHNISRTSVIGVVDSICRVCRQKMDWSYGGYCCERCPGYVVHSKCATRTDVWKGKELEGVPEETKDVEAPYVVIADDAIQHFSHIGHYLRHRVSNVLWEENKRCRACAHPIGLQSFYSCIDCDFLLHQTCAGFPISIGHALYNERLTLVTSEVSVFECDTCHRMSNGFRYQRDDKVFDVLCGTISEPFHHPSHDHPLYYIPHDERRQCNGCNELASLVLACIESDCKFVLDFKCATLPLVIQHSSDYYPFSLCYGKRSNGKHWCDICGKETDVNTWFYTCKDQEDSLHITCVVGDFLGLVLTSTVEVLSKSFEVVLNNSISRPFCKWCKSRCIYPIMLKMLGTSDTYVCSTECLFNLLDPIRRSGSGILKPKNAIKHVKAKR